MIFSFIRYKLFEIKVRVYVENDFFAMNFGDKALSSAFEKFLEKNRVTIATDYLMEDTVSKYFANIPNTDRYNKIELFSYFIWDFILTNGKIPKDKIFAQKKVKFALEHMEFDERGGYKVISPRVIQNFFKSL